MTNDKRHPSVIYRTHDEMLPLQGRGPIRLQILVRPARPFLPSRLNFSPSAQTICTMQAIILSIGDELVLGQTVDTNSAWLSQQLAAIGISVLSHATVGDDQAAIVREVRA